LIYHGLLGPEDEGDVTFQNAGNNTQTTRHLIAEDLNPQQHHCEPQIFSSFKNVCTLTGFNIATN
jgi:hypothetical protein